MSEKGKKSDVFSYFKKSKGEFPAWSHSISWNKGLSNTSWNLC